MSDIVIASNVRSLMDLAIYVDSNFQSGSLVVMGQCSTLDVSTRVAWIGHFVGDVVILLFSM